MKRNVREATIFSRIQVMWHVLKTEPTSVLQRKKMQDQPTTGLTPLR